MSFDVRTLTLIYIRMDRLLRSPPLYNDVWTVEVLRRRRQRVRSWMGAIGWLVASDYANSVGNIRTFPTTRYRRGGDRSENS